MKEHELASAIAGFGLGNAKDYLAKAQEATDLEERVTHLTAAVALLFAHIGAQEEQARHDEAMARMALDHYD